LFYPQNHPTTAIPREPKNKNQVDVAFHLMGIFILILRHLISEGKTQIKQKEILDHDYQEHQEQFRKTIEAFKG